VAVPTSFGSTLSPPCARIDLLKPIVGLDVTEMHPPEHRWTKLSISFFVKYRHRWGFSRRCLR
jgi:hypothetical protein